MSERDFFLLPAQAAQVPLVYLFKSESPKYTCNKLRNVGLITVMRSGQGQIWIND